MVQEHVEQTLPWLLETLSSESSSVERSGAALGLAEVIAVLGDAHLAAIIPGVIAGCSDRAPAVRDGNLTLLVRCLTGWHCWMHFRLAWQEYCMCCEFYVQQLRHCLMRRRCQQLCFLD